MPSDAERLAASECASVVAAAGCGKTELIARAVACATGRQLVLTHTNAGVEAVRRRLRKLGVRADAASVDTIDGWCLKYVSAFPVKSGGGLPLCPTGATDWDLLRRRMATLLERPFIRDVVRASYSGVFVDEYQDCGVDQHALILSLRSLLPTRIVGDPRQAIFGWAGAMPDWAIEVSAAFPPLLRLITPWRWRREGCNADLGDWLAELRTRLDASQPTSLRDSRVTFVELADRNQWQKAAASACFEAASRGGTVVAVMRGQQEFRLLGKLTGGRFQCVEPIEASDGAALVEQLEAALATDRPHLLLRLLDLVASNVRELVNDLGLALSGRIMPSGDLEAAYESLQRVRDGGGAPECLASVEALLALPAARVFRRELAWAVTDTLRDERASSMRGLRDLFRQRRNLTSHIGRRLARCSVGSTLLLKGMEFDHAVVVHTGGPRGFTANDYYVACTRGSRSLTVVSAVDAIDPRTLPA